MGVNVMGHVVGGITTPDDGPLPIVLLTYSSDFYISLINDFFRHMIISTYKDVLLYWYYIKIIGQYTLFRDTLQIIVFLWEESIYW